jgi:hypothetical protein
VLLFVWMSWLVLLCKYDGFLTALHHVKEEKNTQMKKKLLSTPSKQSKLYPFY